MTLVHEPIPREKQGSGYLTDAGVEVAPHTLHCFDCSCGYRARVWYASAGRARLSWDRHVMTTIAAARPGVT